jgi:hypothetical protein
MAISIILHISNEEPLIGEIEELPTPSDSLLVVMNPRKRDGKDLHFLAANVSHVIWPWNKINFVEIMPGDDDEKVIGFVRE